MLETIAMWGGIAGVVISLFAIIILFLTKQSINHILNKDAILFDQNFEIKKNAINSALSLVDQLVDKGEMIKTSADFSQKAQACYNELLCVASDIKLAEDFYDIAISQNTSFDETKAAQFKLMCRKDIGLKNKNARILKRTLNKQSSEIKTTSQFSQPQFSQPVAPQPTQPMPQPRPTVQPTATSTIQQVRPAQPTQPRPTYVQPTTQIKRPTPPKDDQ